MTRATGLGAGSACVAGTPASPRSVTRGESPLTVHIDFVGVVFHGVEPASIIREACAFMGASGEDRGRGLHGYASSVDIGGYALVAFGGDQQRGTVFLQINGAGCHRLARWASFREWVSSLGGSLSRVDIAADDHEGESLSILKALSAWRGGEFAMGGRPPKARLLDDLGSGAGSTFYVGSRDSGKLLRVYEKGKQLGDAVSRWVRAEVELLARDRVLDLDILTRPLDFFAGAYPWFSQFSLIVEKIKTFKRSAEISIQAVTSWARAAVGKSLNVLIHAHHGDIGGLFEDLRRDGVPGRFKFFGSSPGEVCAALT